MNRLLVIVVMFALSLIAPAFAHADTFSFTSPNVVGTTTPGAPADPTDVATYIDFMISLAPGTGGTFSGQSISRSTNLFASLPVAIFVNTSNNQGTTTTIDLGAAGGYTYLFAKYDGQNDESLVWSLANDSGTITIPADGPLGHGLSGWILFGAGSAVPVPEPSSLMLLGTGVLGLFVPIRRKLMPRSTR
jgi:hypothetical protein